MELTTAIIMPLDKKNVLAVLMQRFAIKCIVTLLWKVS